MKNKLCLIGLFLTATHQVLITIQLASFIAQPITFSSNKSMSTFRYINPPVIEVIIRFKVSGLNLHLPTLFYTSYSGSK